MTIILISIVVLGGLWFFFKSSNKKTNIHLIDEVPIEKEIDVAPSEPIKPAKVPIPIVPIEDEGEMPIKPLPINCQKAQFEAAPARFFYTDCCGELHEGEGFQPWEKRAPVSIDSNKPFEGMILLDVEAEIEC